VSSGTWQAYGVWVALLVAVVGGLFGFVISDVRTAARVGATQEQLEHRLTADELEYRAQIADVEDELQVAEETHAREVGELYGRVTGLETLTKERLAVIETKLENIEGYMMEIREIVR